MHSRAGTNDVSTIPKMQIGVILCCSVFAHVVQTEDQYVDMSYCTLDFWQNKTLIYLDGDHYYPKNYSCLQ